MEKNQVDRLYEAIRRMDQIYELWSSRHGIGVYDMQIYYEMLKHGEASITQKDLCRKLDAPKTSINSIIKKQLQSGYIEMHVNPKNKREKMLSLTQEGQRFARALIEPLFRYEEEAVAMIDPQDVEIAIRTQNRFADVFLAMVEQEETGGHSGKITT